jgi:hypothetical protein
MVNLKLNNMFYAKACIKPSLEVVDIERIYYTEEYIIWVRHEGEANIHFPVPFSDIVWLECNSRPIEKKI